MLLLLCFLSFAESPAQRAESLIAELPRHAEWSAHNFTNPTHWIFRFTPPMEAILQIGRPAQTPLLAALARKPEFADQLIILLGGVGDERAIGPIIESMTLTSLDPRPEWRRKTLLAGKLALTNITLAEVNWHRGGGITIDRCPDDPARCWAAWWQENKASFRVRNIKYSRRYSNYPSYGIYGAMARAEPWPPKYLR